MKENIAIIYSTEIEGFFKRIGYLEKLQAGELRCHFCNSILTLENFRGAFRIKGKLNFICREEQCFHEPGNNECTIIEDSTGDR